MNTPGFRGRKQIFEVTLALYALVVAAAAPVLSAPATASPNPGAAPNALPAEKEDPQLAAVRDRLARANSQTAAVLSQLRSITIKSEKVQHDLAKNEGQISELGPRIREAEDQISQTEQKAERVKSAFNARARRIYQNRPMEMLATLFSARTLADMPRIITFWRDLAQEDGRALADSARLSNQLVKEKADLARTSQDLTEQRQHLDSLKSQLASSKAQQTAALARLKDSIQEAVVAERAVLAARAEASAAAARAALAAQGQGQTPRVCPPGSAAKDARLSALLVWYAPAVGTEPFMPPRLSATGVTFNTIASWYGPGFEGCRASSGSTFRSAQMTAASLSLPFGAFVKVTNGIRSVVVVITDRGPYVAGRDIDLSKAAAQAIGIGVGPVKLEILIPSEPAPPYP